MSEKRTELLAPSGDWSSAHSAAAAGADSVYFGVKQFNMRALASNFDISEVKKLVEFLHSRNIKAYLTLNVVMHTGELASAAKILKRAAAAQVDAVIVSDMGVLKLAREAGLNVHLSTQASVSNFESFRFYSSLGVSRIVLARECTLRDINEIKQLALKENISCQVECFAHGAMCSSVSGRCYLSSDVFGRSANRGECLQPCRREYRITDTDGECEFVLGSDYVLSAKDMCTVRILGEIISSGADALKIEGRMRSPEYVLKVTGAYRRAIDLYYDNALTEDVKSSIVEELKSSSFTRGLSEGFYNGRASDLGAVVETAYQKIFVGEVRKFYKRISVAEVEVMDAPIAVGRKLLVYGKSTPASYALIESMEVDHRRVMRAERGQSVGIKLPFAAHRGDKVFLWKELSDES